jgi:hypothetical protein
MSNLCTGGSGLPASAQISMKTQGKVIAHTRTEPRIAE